MSSPYEKALERRKQLEAELAEIKFFLALYERYSGTEPEHHEAVEDSEPPVLDFNRRGNPGKIAAAAEAILRDARRPMTRGELADEIEKRGTALPATDKAKYVGTILWRRGDRFENVDGGYWLKGVGVPAKPDEFDLTGKIGP